MTAKEYMWVNECSIYISPAGQNEENMHINKQFNTQEVQNKLTP